MRVTLVIFSAFSLVLSCVYSLSCTNGACCKDGNILPNGTVCRQALDECDITEFCSGVSSDCPPDVTVQDDTYCKDETWPGVCENGTCMTLEAISRYDECLDHCSENGKCNMRGICVCNEGWQASPKCDKKSLKPNTVQDGNPKPNEMSTILEKHDEQQKMNRIRREAKNDHYHQHLESETTDNNQKKLLAIQDPPQEDTFTKLKKHPLFLPIIITIVGFVILVAFTISAKLFYESEKKAQSIRGRIKVEKASSHIPANVSKITDQSINIDVGR